MQIKGMIYHAFVLTKPEGFFPESQQYSCPPVHTWANQLFRQHSHFKQSVLPLVLECSATC